MSHAIILDSYPAEQHGKAMALWGAGSVLGSVVGPVVGGYLTEFISWRWIYYINVPLGLVALIGSIAFVPETPRNPRRLDWMGFLTLALGVGALQMMLDRGQRLDWFESQEIVVLAWLAAIGFYLFATHTLTNRRGNWFLDPHLILHRKFFICLVLISFYGFLSMPPMVLMPSFLEHLRGYTIDAVGLLQAPRGVGMLAALIVSGRITGKVDPRILIAFGYGCLGLTNYEMSTWTAEVGEWPIVWTGLLQGVGAGITLVPIQIIAFPELPSHQRTDATSVFNLVRSVCSSIGVSFTLTSVRRHQHAESLMAGPVHLALQRGVAQSATVRRRRHDEPARFGDDRSRDRSAGGGGRLQRGFQIPRVRRAGFASGVVVHWTHAASFGRRSRAVGNVDSRIAAPLHLAPSSAV